MIKIEKFTKYPKYGYLCNCCGGKVKIVTAIEIEDDSDKQSGVDLSLCESCIDNLINSLVKSKGVTK